ncbi:serine/threonine-protein kinase [Antrihabitans cavernicola]|uniref:non-specific serine/threonine protein kinase n=1 Tax=Antrihabitans cavernicola TaxID=2495913 RepID=A0A5A7S4F0_9NOCA|nr:serine/threonine-protein kinase [Spelaeibacter cavernicola]KAA0021060.1 serine/threonine protein kinase [Spelaeibacter cavernicola]
MTLSAGNTFAGYVVQCHLGRGGMSEVYRVTNPTSGRTEALKILEPEIAFDGAARARFQREFDIAHTLHHPNLVSMYSDGLTDDVPWLTMQFVDGPSASTLIPLLGARPDLNAVIDVVDQIADGLDYAHGRDVLHRDVKPGNILVESTPSLAVLTDFGVAYLLDDSRPLVRKGRILSTIPYAAPELLQGQQLLPATDQYALACTLVELLTGRTPFPYSTTFAIAHAHIASTPPLLTKRAPWLPPAINAIVGKALAKDPTDRYRTCGEFIDLAAAVLESTSDEVAGRTPLGFRRWLRTRMASGH